VIRDAHHYLWYVGGTKVDKLIRKKTKSCNAKKEETASTQGERGCGLKSCSQAARRHARKVYSSGLATPPHRKGAHRACRVALQYDMLIRTDTART
jgi:hypothetical protein